MDSVPDVVNRTVWMLGISRLTASAYRISCVVAPPRCVPRLLCASTASTTSGGLWPIMRHPVAHHVVDKLVSVHVVLERPLAVFDIDRKRRREPRLVGHATGEQLFTAPMPVLGAGVLLPETLFLWSGMIQLPRTLLTIARRLYSLVERADEDCGVLHPLPIFRPRRLDLP